MSELAKRLNQCKKPTGDLGKVVADSMNESHFELTGWGLGKVDIKENYTILDVGCGGGKTINRLVGIAKNGKVIGVDYSLDCVNWSKEFNKDFIEEGRVEVYNASVEKLPFEDHKFDLVTAVETVYFWPNIVESFKEIKRVLKPGGNFIIINEMYANDKFKEKNEELKSLSDMEIYGEEQFKNFFKESGYSDISIHTIEDKNWLCIIGKN